MLYKFVPDIESMPEFQRANAALHHYTNYLDAENKKKIDSEIEKIPIFGELTGLRKNPIVSRKFDLYQIEIKSKTIAMFFKFFQREEAAIQKAAKKCLSRLLKKELINP